MAPPGGFGTLEEFSEEPTNPWKSGSRMAPFDQEVQIKSTEGLFFILMDYFAVFHCFWSRRWRNSRFPRQLYE